MEHVSMVFINVYEIIKTWGFNLFETYWKKFMKLKIKTRNFLKCLEKNIIEKSLILLHAKVFRVFKTSYTEFRYFTKRREYPLRNSFTLYFITATENSLVSKKRTGCFAIR